MEKPTWREPLYELRRFPTTQWGLAFRPSLVPNYSDDVDGTDVTSFRHSGNVEIMHYTVLDQQVLRDVLIAVHPKVIVEVGVHACPPPRPGEGHRTSTEILIEDAPEDAVYIGVDIGDRTADSTTHPGPWALCEAVDRRYFEVRKYGTDGDDYGMAVLRRIA